MVEITVDRLSPLLENKDIYVSTGKHLASILKNLLPDVKFAIEPMAKNTAACIGLSAIKVMEDDPDAIMFIETTDHIYKDEDLYIKHIKAAEKMAEQDNIVLIGIKPTHPHTGFGYIHQGELLKTIDGVYIYQLKEFKEKPNLITAKRFLESGDYLWNSGMFIAKVSVMLETMKKHMPELYEALMKIKQSCFSEKVLREEFEKLESISIDYGIMEKAENTVVVRGEMHWDDIGDWDAMERVHRKDTNGNVINALFEGSASNCIIFGDTNRTIKAENIDNIIIVDTKDSLLVCKKKESQKAKDAVQKIIGKNPALFRDYTNNPQKLWININSNNCTVKGDYVIATIDVENLSIEKKEDEIIIKKVDL
jgi:mannose-1-phosphate guanylyltransferase